MDDKQIVENAIGAVDNVAGTASEEEIAAAIAEIEAERDGQDRSGE